MIVSLLLLVGLVGAMDLSDKIPLYDDQYQALMDVFDEIGCPETKCLRFDADSACPLRVFGGADFECTNGIVRGLSLTFMNLRATIPTALAGLNDLLELDLSYNRLYGTIPTEFGQLSWLTKLAINNNQLVGTLPSQMPWKRLDIFVATFNNLTGTIPSQAQPTDCWIQEVGDTNCIDCTTKRDWCKAPLQCVAKDRTACPNLPNPPTTISRRKTFPIDRHFGDFRVDDTADATNATTAAASTTSVALLTVLASVVRIAI